MEKTNDKVSVVIPTYNRADLLEKAVASLQSQTYKNLEIIIVDDCSTDHTFEIVQKMDDSRIIYIKHEKNKGGSESRNTGIQQGSGEYIAFLDSDDQWLPEKITLQLEVFRENPDAGVVYTGVKVVESERLIREIVPENRGDILRELIKFNCIDTTSSIMVKKELLTKIGGFDTAIPSCQDWDLYLRLAQITEFDYVKIPLVLFNQHPGERITTNKTARLNGHLYIYKKFRDLAERQGKGIFKKFIITIWKNIFKNGIINQDYMSIAVSRKILKEGLNGSRLPLKIIFYYLTTYINLKVLLFLYKVFKKNGLSRKRFSKPAPLSLLEILHPH